MDNIHTSAAPEALGQSAAEGPADKRGLSLA